MKERETIISDKNRIARDFSSVIISTAVSSWPLAVIH